MAALNSLARASAIALTFVLLASCSGWEPFDYHETSNIPEGPGLVSGTKGGWTIFRIEEKKKPKPKPKAEETAAEDKRDQNEHRNDEPPPPNLP